MTTPTKRNKKFSPDEVEWLLLVAKGGDKSTIPVKHAWITHLSDSQAREELVERFKRMTSNLINVCITGRPNPWSSFQKTFLRMFSGKRSSLDSIAQMLKAGLEKYDTEELFHTGEVAILHAIQISNSNLASTIVVCFHDLIESLLDEKGKVYTEELPKTLADPNENPVIDIEMESFLQSLTVKEREIADKIISGRKIRKVPASLALKFKRYMGQDPSI